MLLGYARGKVGDLVFSRRLGQQVTKAYNPSPLNPKTEAQMMQRTKLAGLVAAYRAMRVILDHSFTNRKEGQTSYNVFVSSNMAIAPFLSKQQAEQGVVVVLPYIVAKGVLSRIFVSGSGDNAYTNIALGSLVIDDDTTIAEFSQAVVDNNAGWEYGDQLTYFSVIQTALPGTSDFPHVSAQKFKVTLDQSNTETLRTYLPDYGSATVDGFLGHGSHYAAGGFCWIHSRKDAQGALQVSTQELICNIDNSQWTGADQQEYAIRSYGSNMEGYLVPGKDNASPVNIDLEIISMTFAPGNGDDVLFYLNNTAPATYRPKTVVTGDPFTITAAFAGSNLGLLAQESVKMQVSTSGEGPDPQWSEPIAITSIDVLGAGVNGTLQFPYTFAGDGDRISRVRMTFNGKVIFAWSRFGEL